MEVISGYVDHFLYEAENGYKVIVLMVGEEEVVCTGKCPALTVGITIEAKGEYMDHPTYGHQFKMAQYVEIAPQGLEEIERYLASGAVKGIGAALAKRIIQKFGEDTLRIMDEEPERLAEIKGISTRMAMEISQNMEDKKELREAIMHLSKFGISNALALKIYNRYGIGLYAMLQENPYKMAEDISGVGFKIADGIAMQLGIKMDSQYRIQCGILYTLSQSVAEGHCYLPEENLAERSAALLETTPELVRTQISNLSVDRKVILRQDRVYLQSYFYTELSCAKKLLELDRAVGESYMLPGQRQQLRGKLEKTAERNGLILEEHQLEAALESICNGVFILSGGPGTGKTTTINLMIQYFQSEGLDLLLAAPTGRAAKRMSEATGYEAKTIHRLLELNGALDEEDKRKVRFERNEENPLDADVVIIDEMSMVDVSLFQALLQAIVPGTRLILVGDVDQLPSIGPGQVLKDIMDSKCFHCVVLQKIFRQKNGSDIVVNAHKINRGEEVPLDNKSEDFFFLERQNVNVIYKHMVELVRDKLPKYVQASSFDIQVLTPMRKGALGTLALNPILQEYLNPPHPSKAEHETSQGLFREGDKVMQIKNNYELEWEVLGNYQIVIDKGQGVFNGDMGVIKEINERQSYLVVEFDEHRRVTYPFQILEELELCYAVTIHKSQGGEYPAVLMPLLSGPAMLMNRNLLYTGITRAKKLVVILGQKDVFQAMIHNESENRRYTSLGERIRELA